MSDMKGFSIRTIMLFTLGSAMFLKLCLHGATSVLMYHTILVLSFAIPSGSWAFDRTGSSRGAAIGTCVGATIGTLVISTMVLGVDYWWIYVARR